LQAEPSMQLASSLLLHVFLSIPEVLNVLIGLSL